MSDQAAQHGDHNSQSNYFAPVTQHLFINAFESLQDVAFDPAPLVRDLDLARFTGRNWLIEQIDDFITAKSRGYVIIQAEAGVGKSTLAAYLVGTRPWLHHFTRLPGGRSPVAARKSLAAQLIARWSLLEEWARGGALPVASCRPDWFARLLEAAAVKRDRERPGEPIVMVVDGLDEAETESLDDHGLPLGLPESLPNGVFVVATSQFGIDRALHGICNPADWLQIEVEGADNLDDMRCFIENVTSTDDRDSRLLEILSREGVDLAWFRSKVAGSCAGVWIYLRYVLDEIREGLSDPRSVDRLPGDLAGYYAKRVQRWRGDPDDEPAQRRWEEVRLPLLGVLAAARAPLTVAELASFAGVRSAEAARTFIEESARAFLSHDDSEDPSPRYALRHQSLRDLLIGRVPASRPDLTSLAQMLAGQVRLAHRSIAAALIPPGLPGERDWDSCSPYARLHLPAHAATDGALDGLACDPGFLLAADPGAVLAQRGNLHAPDSKRAMAAYESSLHEWEPPSRRLARLTASAARVRATVLTTACARYQEHEWQIRWAAWSGHAHRTLPGHEGPVLTVAIGRAGDRDVIVSGSVDGTVQVWDAITGDLVFHPLRGHNGSVSTVAVGRAGDRDVIVSGSKDGTVRVWDAVTGTAVVPPLPGHEGPVSAVMAGRAGDRDVIVSGSYEGTIRVWDIISGSKDGTVRIWDAVAGDSVGTPLGHGGPVSAVAIGRAGIRDVIVSGSEDMTVRVWDAITGDLAVSPLTGHEGVVYAVAIGRAGSRDVIVSGCFGGTVRVWDAIIGSLIGIPLNHGGPVSAVAIGKSGTRDVIVSGSYDGTVRVWDAVTGDPVVPPLADRRGFPVSAVAVGRAGDRDVIVSGSYGGTVQVWDAVTGDPIGNLLGHGSAVRAVAIGRAGTREVIVSGSEDKLVRVWDAITSDLVVPPLTGHNGVVYTVAIGRAGGRDVIVSGAHGGTVRVWDAITGDVIGTPLTGHDRPVSAVAIGRVGNRDVIASGSRDGSVMMREGQWQLSAHEADL